MKLKIIQQFFRLLCARVCVCVRETACECVYNVNEHAIAFHCTIYRRANDKRDTSVHSHFGAQQRTGIESSCYVFMYT